MKPMRASEDKADSDLAQKLDAARRQAATPLTREEVGQIIGEMVDSLHGDLSSVDLKIYRELESLTADIQSARAEIAAIRPDEISTQFIPTAADELDAVVGATAEAAGRILDCAEQIQEIAEGVDAEVRDKLVALVTDIFEACNFQDITGQRITKVVKTLQNIESRIGKMVALLGEEINKAAEASGTEAPVSDPNDEQSLLNGPQLEGDGIDQDEIDALLNSFD